MTRTLDRTSFDLSPPRADRAALDPVAAREIGKVREIVGADIWPDPRTAGSSPGKVVTPPGPATQRAGASARGACLDPTFYKEMEGLLAQDLAHLEKATKGRSTLEDVLRQDPGRWALLAEALQIVKRTAPSFEAETLLGVDELAQYLFARAVYTNGIEGAEAVAAFMLDERDHDGLGGLYREIRGRAATTIVEEKKIKVDAPALAAYLDRVILSRPFSFATGVFAEDLEKRIRGYANDAPLIEYVRDASAALSLRATPDEERDLTAYLRRSSVDLDALKVDSRRQYIFSTLARFRDGATISLVSSDEPLDAGDFGVRYHTESSEALKVNTNNVLCAAQLFYVMTMGDELGIFDAVDLLVRKYLSRSLVDIRSQRLLQDLQNYALNDEFTDLSSGRTYRRTKPEERRMFYRQVFNFGPAEPTEGVLSNPDFDLLWRDLIVEVGNYLTAVQKSADPDRYIPREGVAQAIEAIQYNLSTQCSGMAKVMAPVIYKELDFLIERILKSEEIVAQLALHSSRSYTKVVERILQEERGHGVNVAALQRKAEDGHTIIDSIAKWTGSLAADDARFSSFVRQVHAFIRTGEKLESAAKGRGDRPVDETVEAGTVGNGADVEDDWNF